MRKKLYPVLILLMALLLSACGMRTVDQLYAVPKRSPEYRDLQKAIDEVMPDLVYSAPLTGENRQTVQMADLNGDGIQEYLLFARGTTDDPLKIFIFEKMGDSYQLLDTITGQGSAFDFVEYAQVDGGSSKELIVGVRVSEQVLRYLSVYAFDADGSRQLMAVNYSKFIPADLDQDGLSDLLIISPGEEKEDHGVAALYRFEEDTMVRSLEARLSAHPDQIKRIMVSTVHGGIPAVYVASSVAESAIITDVFMLREGKFVNVPLSAESGTSVETLRNYYIYADDVDSDGTLELPRLIDMHPVHGNTQTATQHLIRWYALTKDGDAVDKLHTFHNFDGGWYLTLTGDWASRVSVAQSAGICTFYIWDEMLEKAEKIMTVYALTGMDRDMLAESEERFVLYKSEGITYAAKLEVGALSYGLTVDNLSGCFHMIHMDWKSGET